MINRGSKARSFFTGALRPSGHAPTLNRPAANGNAGLQASRFMQRALPTSALTTRAAKPSTFNPKPDVEIAPHRRLYEVLEHITRPTGPEIPPELSRVPDAEVQGGRMSQPWSWACALAKVNKPAALVITAAIVVPTLFAVLGPVAIGPVGKFLMILANSFVPELLGGLMIPKSQAHLHPDGTWYLIYDQARGRIGRYVHGFGIMAVSYHLIAMVTGAFQSSYELMLKSLLRHPSGMGGFLFILAGIFYLVPAAKGLIDRNLLPSEGKCPRDPWSFNWNLSRLSPRLEATLYLFAWQWAVPQLFFPGYGKLSTEFVRPLVSGSWTPASLPPEVSSLVNALGATLFTLFTIFGAAKLTALFRHRDHVEETYRTRDLPEGFKRPLEKGHVWDGFLWLGRKLFPMVHVVGFLSLLPVLDVVLFNSAWGVGQITNTIFNMLPSKLAGLWWLTWNVGTGLQTFFASFWLASLFGKPPKPIKGVLQ